MARMAIFDEIQLKRRYSGHYGQKGSLNEGRSERVCKEGQKAPFDAFYRPVTEGRRHQSKLPVLIRKSR